MSPHSALVTLTSPNGAAPAMPTYTERFYCEFIEQPDHGLGIVTPALFRVSFRFKDWTGGATEVYCYHDEPVAIEPIDSSGNPFTVFQPTKATFRLRAHSAWDNQAFYDNDEDTIQVVILRDLAGTGTVYKTHWAGWVLPTDFREAYAKKPYPIEVSATDGLGLLKERPLLDASGKRLTGNIRLSTAVRVALSQTGLSLPITTGINLFDYSDLAVGQTLNGKADPARDPLYQTLVQADTFVTDEGETEFSRDTLIKLLEPFGAVLQQVDGDYWIVQRSATPGGVFDPWDGSALTIRTRRYNSSDPYSQPVAGSSTSQNLNVPVYPGLSVQALSGSATGRNIRKTGIRVEQTFGRLLSQLPNGDWSQVDGTGLPTDWSRNNSSQSLSYRVGSGTEIDPYALHVFGAGDEKFNRDTPAVYRRIVYPEVGPLFQQNQTYTLSGKFRVNNVRAAKIVVVAYRKVSGRIIINLLEPGGSWNDFPTTKESKGILLYHYLEASAATNNQMISKPGLSDYSITTDPINNVLWLDIWFCAGEALTLPNGQPKTDGNPYVEYLPARLQIGETGLVLSGQNVRVAKPNRKADTVATLTMGNVPDAAKPYQRLTTFFHLSGNSLVSNTYLTNPSDSARTQGKTPLQWVADNYARQYLQSAVLYEGTLVGRLPFMGLSVLRFGDIGVTDNNGIFQAHPHVMTRWKYLPRSCRWANVTALQLMTATPAVGLPAPKPFWQTPDGEVEQNPDADPSDNQVPNTDLDKWLRTIPPFRPLVPGNPPDLVGMTPDEQKESDFIVEVRRDNLLIGRVQGLFRGFSDVFDIAG